MGFEAESARIPFFRCKFAGIVACDTGMVLRRRRDVLRIVLPKGAYQEPRSD